MIAKSKLRITAKRPLTFCQFFFFGAGGGGAIFSLAISGELFVAISSASALFASFQGACPEFTLPGPPPPDFSQAN